MSSSLFRDESTRPFHETRCARDEFLILIKFWASFGTKFECCLVASELCGLLIYGSLKGTSSGFCFKEDL